jgi:hypothetical protein
MKPVNSGQRRKAFLSYVLLFFITMIPFCLSIYLYGKVDEAENVFLREKYRQSQQLNEVKYSEERVYSALNSDIIAVQNQITQSQGVSTTSPESGNIEPKINQLNRTLRELQNELRDVETNPTEALMLEMIKAQSESLEKLNGIYSETFIKLRDERDEVKAMKERLNAAGIAY